jgi:hypothetical protein
MTTVGRLASHPSLPGGVVGFNGPRRSLRLSVLGPAELLSSGRSVPFRGQRLNTDHDPSAGDDETGYPDLELALSRGGLQATRTLRRLALAAGTSSRVRSV